MQEEIHHALVSSIRYENGEIQESEYFMSFLVQFAGVMGVFYFWGLLWVAQLFGGLFGVSLALV